MTLWIYVGLYWLIAVPVAIVVGKLLKRSHGG